MPPRGKRRGKGRSKARKGKKRKRKDKYDVSVGEITLAEDEPKYAVDVGDISVEEPPTPPEGFELLDYDDEGMTLYGRGPQGEGGYWSPTTGEHAGTMSRWYPGEKRPPPIASMVPSSQDVEQRFPEPQQQMAQGPSNLPQSGQGRPLPPRQESMTPEEQQILMARAASMRSADPEGALTPRPRPNVGATRYSRR